MLEVNLNKKVKIITSEEITETDKFFVYGKPIQLLFTDSTDISILSRKKKILEANCNLIVVTQLAEKYLRDSKLTYLIVDRADFNEKLFKEIPSVDMISYYGSISRDIVESIVSKYNIRLVYGAEDTLNFVKRFSVSKEEYKSTTEEINKINEIVEKDLDKDLDLSKKLLIYRDDCGLGDLLMITACLKSLKEYYKDWKIVIGCNKKYHTLFENNSYVDKVISNFNEKDYDKVFNLTRFFEHENYPMDGWKANHKSRVDLLYEDAFKIPAIDRRLLYYITEDEQKWAKAYLSKYEKGEYLVGFSIDAAGMSRNWPINYFFECQHILKDKKVTSILFGNRIGTQNKYDYAGIFREGMINATGLTLRETAALINEVDLMVCVDSGLLHLSAALEKKTIALFGNIRPLNRILYYDTVEELYSVGELDCIPCNDALYINKCMKVCNDLSEYRQPAMCMWRLTVDKVLTKILMDLGLLKSKSVKYRPKLSFAMMTHNEEAWIGQCLDRINEVADEIVIIDDSKDDTRKIAKKYNNVKIYNVKDLPCPKECNFCKKNNIDIEKIGRPCSAKLRQQSFEACTGNWIFRIDADEVIRKEDTIKLRYLVDYADDLFPSIKIFWFTTVNFFLDENHYKVGTQGHAWFPDVHKRLQKNDESLHKWTLPAHERMIGITRRGQVEFLDNQKEFNFQHMSNWFYVYHYGYLQPRKERVVDSIKYEKMKVLLHTLDNKNIEPWVWKKPTKVILPPEWGTGICEYEEGEKG